MLNFSDLKLVKHRKAGDNFVGIRKTSSGEGFEFCLPNGFEDFPEGNFDIVRDLFFRMYRTFKKFELDNTGSGRFRLNDPSYQRDQDQTVLSGGGVSVQTEDGEACVLYSKIKMIERILESYDDLAIYAIQKKSGRTEKIDYSQLHKYLDKAVYLEDDIIYIDQMDLPRSVLLYESTDLVDLYCYILDEIAQQLDEDVPENIKTRLQDVRFLSNRFKEAYLTTDQSLFKQDTYEETLNTLKEVLDKIDNHTYYKDADYWGLYEAVETFLYGEINPEQSDGEFWGIKGFSFVWEDICHTYFFRTYFDGGTICYADTDIPLKNHFNEERDLVEQNRIGNCSTHDGTKDWSRWVYSSSTSVNLPKKRGVFGWNELLCIELNLNPGTFIYSHKKFSQRKGRQLQRRFPRPDMVLEAVSQEQNKKYKGILIIDYKDLPFEFFLRNQNLPFESTEDKYRLDVIKQLTYELALQQSHNVIGNWFLIPSFQETVSNDAFRSELKLNVNGIEVVKGNFYMMQDVYLQESLL